MSAEAANQPKATGSSERQFVLLLDRAVGARRLGEAGIQEARTAGRSLGALLGTLLEDRGQVQLVVDGHQIECHGEQIKAADVDALALPLARQGLRVLTVLRSADLRTLAAVIDVLTGVQNGAGGPIADDTVTRLWKAEIPGLSYEAELKGLITASTDGQAISELSSEVFEALSQVGGIESPPPAKDFVEALKIDHQARQAPLTLEALRAIAEAISHPEALGHLPPDVIRRLLWATVQGLVEASAPEALERLAIWFKSLLAQGDPAAHPYVKVVRGVSEQALESDMLAARGSNHEGALSAVFARGLGEVAEELLAERFQTGRREGAAKTIVAWSHVDPQAAKRALVQRIGVDTDTKTIEALMSAVARSKELFGPNVATALMAVGSVHEGTRICVLEALAAHGDCSRPDAVWQWVEEMSLPQAPAVLRKRTLAVLPRIVGTERAMHYLDGVLKARSLFGKEVHVGMQLSVVRALRGYHTAAAKDVLQRHRQHRAKPVRSLIEKVLAG